MIIAVTVAVPIIVVVPVTIGAPFLAIRVVPGVIVRPAFLELFFQFSSGFICLGAVLAVLAKFMPIMFLRLLDAAAAFRAFVIVGRRSWRRRDQQSRTKSESRNQTPHFAIFHFDLLDQLPSYLSEFSDWQWGGEVALKTPAETLYKWFRIQFLQ